MSSKKTYLITTFHHSLLNLNSNISKQKLLKKMTGMMDILDFFIKTIKKQQVIKLDDGHT